MPLAEGIFIYRELDETGRETGAVQKHPLSLNKRFIKENGQVSGEYIGKGAQGIVIVVTDNCKNIEVVLKRIQITPPLAQDATEEQKRDYRWNLQKNSQCTMRELRQLEMLFHPHIVSFFGAFRVDNFLYLIMEKMDDCLYDILNSPKERELRLKTRLTFNLKYAAFTFYQLLKALEYMDENGIMHRDIKPHNVGMNVPFEERNGEKTFIVKFFDLGFSRNVGKDDRAYTKRRGSPLYKAPEILFGRKEGYDTKVDVWSLAVTVVELYTGRVGDLDGLFAPAPGEHRSESGIMKKMLYLCGRDPDVDHYSEAGYDFSSPIWSQHIYARRPMSEWINRNGNPIIFDEEGSCTESNFFDLLDKVFVFDPKRRLSAAACLKHAFFKDVPQIFAREFSAPLYAPVDYHEQLLKAVDRLNVE